VEEISQAQPHTLTPTYCGAAEKKVGGWQKTHPPTLHYYTVLPWLLKVEFDLCRILHDLEALFSC